MVISLNQESEVIYKAAFDKDLIWASCRHVSRWPKNGGRQKILEKMVCCLDIGFPYIPRICPFWPSQPSSNVWGVCERRICSDEPQRACTSCCYCTINLWCHPTHLLLSVKFSVQWIFATKTPPTLTSFCNRWQIFVFHQCWEIGRPDSGSLFPNKEVKLRANHNDICVSGLALPGTRLLSLQFSTCPPSFTFHRVTKVVNTTASSNSRLAFPPPLWLTRMDGGRSGKSSDENSGTALTPPPLINVTRAVVFQSSHSNFIADYQQSGWSLSKHFWACAKLPSITDPSLIPKHLGELPFVFRNVTPRLPRSISKEPVFCR